MIAMFKPIGNSLGYDVREFEIKNGKPGKYKWLNVQENRHKATHMFKPRSACKDKMEYLAQFEHFREQASLF